MLLVLVSSSSISFASPNFVPCDYYYYVTYDVSPKGGGTVNGYVDQTIKYTYNNIPCQDNEEMFTFAAYPSIGYGFVDWSTGSSANNTSVTLSADSSYTIGGNFILLPQILSLETYTSSSDPGTQSSAPPNSVNNTNPSTATSSNARYCGNINNNNDPYCLSVAKSTIGGSTYYGMLFVDNSSSCTDGQYTCGLQSGYYPNGNTTISITLKMTDSNDATPTAMSIDFVNANGQVENVGNSFEENYGSTLSTALTSMSTDVYNLGNSYVTNNQPGAPGRNITLYLTGENIVTASYALGDLPTAFGARALCAGFATNTWSVNIPHLLTLVISWQWSIGCILATAVASGDTASLVIATVTGAGAVAIVVLGGTEVATVAAVSHECLSYSYQ